MKFEPKSTDEAAAMIDAGLLWLELNAPDKLKEISDRVFEGVPRLVRAERPIDQASGERLALA